MRLKIPLWCYPWQNGNHILWCSSGWSPLFTWETDKFGVLLNFPNRSTALTHAGQPDIDGKELAVEMQNFPHLPPINKMQLFSFLWGKKLTEIYTNVWVVLKILFPLFSLFQWLLLDFIFLERNGKWGLKGVKYIAFNFFFFKQLKAFLLSKWSVVIVKV